MDSCCRIVVAGHSGVGKRTAIDRLCKELYQRDHTWRALDRAGEDQGKKDQERRVADYFEIDDFASKRDLYSDSWRQQAKEWGKSVDRKFKEWKSAPPKYAFLGVHLSYQTCGRFSSPLLWYNPYCPETDIKKGGMFEIFLNEIMGEFQPNYIITLIDDLAACQNRIESGYRFRLRDFIAWRDIELFFADLLAQRFINCDKDSLSGPYPFHNSFLVSVRQSATSVANLICDRATPKIYCSYPVTDTRKHPERLDQIRDVVTSLGEEFVVFDPMAIDDVPLKVLLLSHLTHVLSARGQNIYSDGGRTSIKKMIHDHDHLLAELANKTKGDNSFLDIRPLSLIRFDLPPSDQWQFSATDVLCGSTRESISDLHGDEIAEICAPEDKDWTTSSLDQQIRSRDYRLIDQADCIVTYRPLWRRFDGTTREVFSGGTGKEWDYAHNSGKPTILLHDPHEDGDISRCDVWDQHMGTEPEFTFKGNLSDSKERKKILDSVKKCINEKAKVFLENRHQRR